MKRAGMVTLGGVAGLAIAIAILGLFVHRPPECGEPSACGDDYLLPALPMAGIAFAATLVFALVQSKLTPRNWRRYLLSMAAWMAVVSVAIALAYVASGG